MGRLIGLELYNFKSYKGLSSIGFGDANFTSIIGPNGAGKSNMMDAISFVLGMQSSQLRSQNMTDLIYRGRIGGDDPTKAHVSIIYQKDDLEKIKLSRSVNLNGSSEYKINDQAVTALHYSNVLKKENILIKARNFLVFQGDVEQIASQSPKDLTKLIETISGSGELAQEYDELKEAKDLAHEFANSVFARKRVLSSESKQYKEQLEEQEAFEKKLIEKTDLIKLLNLYKLYHNEKQHQELISKIDEEKLKLAELNEELKLEEKTLKSSISEYSKIELSIKKKVSLLNQYRNNLEENSREIVPLEQNKTAFTNKINICRRKMREVEHEISKQQEKVWKIEKSLQEAKRMMDEFMKKDAQVMHTEIDSDGLIEYENLRANFLADGGAQLEEQLENFIAELESGNIIINNHNKQIENSKERISELNEIIKEELMVKLDDISNEINEALEQKVNLEKSKAALIKSKEVMKYEELDLQTKLRDTLIKIDELSSEQRDTQKQKKLRENVNMLRKLSSPGSIKGVVSELVRPSQHQYSNALQCLLGAHIDSIVVESTQVAYKCIEILKERRSGVATFIPLDSISVPSMNLGYLRSLHPQVKPGLDIVEYDDNSLEMVVEYIVSDSLVAENIDVARQLKWGEKVIDKKIVTLDGSLIHKSGLMTGGTSAGSTVRWDKNEWKRLNDLKDELLEKLSQLTLKKPKEIEINQLLEEINRWEDKMPILRNKRQNIERMIEDKKKEITFHENSLKEQDELRALREESLNDLKKRMDDLNNEIEKLQNQIYREFCEKYNLSNGIQDFEDSHGSAYRNKAKERTQYLNAISTFSSKLDFEKMKLSSAEGRLEKLKKNLEEYEVSLVDALENIESIKSKTDTIDAEIEVNEDEKKMLEQDLSKKKKIVKEAENTVEELNFEISEVSRLLLNHEEVIMNTDVERVNILKNCKIDNINIPLRDGLIDIIPISDNIEELIKDIYEIQIDYSSMAAKYKSSFNQKTEAELEARIAQVVEDLDQLAPNAKAVERLKEAEKKLKDFDKDLTKAKQKESKCIERFNKVKEKRFGLFMEAFNHISGEIDKVFKELTKSPISPLGGSAYLTMEDDDEPYNAGIKYHAMPPMKRFRDMELLSGGEKTVAALALLFAIHSYQPSPFFVLDEVDAALDNSNVAKIANYIKSHASPQFQFIVISLKNSLFETSDSLVGIYRDQNENSSKTVTLDLRKYSDEEVPSNDTSS